MISYGIWVDWWLSLGNSEQMAALLGQQSSLMIITPFIVPISIFTKKTYIFYSRLWEKLKKEKLNKKYF